MKKVEKHIRDSNKKVSTKDLSKIKEKKKKHETKRK